LYYTRTSIATTAELRVKGTGLIPPPKILANQIKVFQSDS
jgi:hypothetical protein